MNEKNETMNPGGGEPASHATLDIGVKVYPVRESEKQGNLLAFANVTLGGCFAVHDIRVMNSAKGPFVSMPSKKGRDDKYYETCFPITAQMRSDLNAAILNEFQRVMEQPRRETAQSAQRGTASRPARTAAKGKRTMER